MAESNLVESAEVYRNMVRTMTDQELALILALSMTPEEVDAAVREEGAKRD